jgi:hypothetical protein
MKAIVRYAILVLPIVFVITSSGVADDDPVMREVKNDHLDSAWISAKLPTGVPVVVRQFDTDNTDFGTGANPKKKKYRILAEELRENAPPLLAGTIARGLGIEKLFSEVTEYEDGMEIKPGTLIVEGSFTELNPGSQGKRFWVGLGAGKSKVCVKGQVVEAEGKVLGKFEHCRSGVMGFTGGKSEGLMSTDVRNTGVRITEFMTDWARGSYGN